MVIPPTGVLLSPIGIAKSSDRKFHLHMRILILCALVFLSTLGCDFKTKSPSSVLVIAVDSLAFDSVACESEAEESGFAQFCQNAVRFTHAYTPSVLSAPAMASLLTGLYPIDHGLRHNGSDFVKESFETTAEAALKNGYRTALFSGGPPILRRTGLSQGFEIFDDNFALEPAQPYRPARENFRAFMRWLRDEVGNEKFFSIIYLPDPLFSEVSTFDPEGEKRGRGHESQIREIDESLFELIRELKELKRWDQTNVFLVGLNGQESRQRGRELTTTSLLSANSQVALYIKPLQKERDTGLKWTIDKNLSLVDVGYTLYEMVGAEPPHAGNEKLEVVSLRLALDEARADWDQNRWLMIESGWSLWKGLADIRYGLRKGAYLGVFDERLQIFNSLTDRYEATPLSESDASHLTLFQDMRNQREVFQFPFWTSPPQAFFDRIHIAQAVFQRNQNYEDSKHILLNAIRNYPQDKQFAEWLAQFALDNSDWATLDQMGGVLDERVWQFVALYQQQKSNKHIILRGCGQYFKNWKTAKSEKIQCEDPLLLKFLKWFNEKDPDDKEEAQEQFLRDDINKKLDDKLAQLNYLNHLVWDVGTQLPSGPSLSDLMMTLPDFKRELAITKERRTKSLPDFK